MSFLPPPLSLSLGDHGSTAGVAPPQQPHTSMAWPRRSERWLGLAQAARGCRDQRFGAAKTRGERRKRVRRWVAAPT
jgi:hypothetical protein